MLVRALYALQDVQSTLEVLCSCSVYMMKVAVHNSYLRLPEWHCAVLKLCACAP
jgi:hypothetical protein